MRRLILLLGVLGVVSCSDVPGSVTPSATAAISNDAAVNLPLMTARKAQSSMAVNPSSTLVFGGTVLFDTTITGVPGNIKPDRIYVQLGCRQNGVLVDAATQAPSSAFTLGQVNSPWAAVGGPANCTADVFYWATNGTRTVLASTAFDVAA